MTFLQHGEHKKRRHKRQVVGWKFSSIMLNWHNLGRVLETHGKIPMLPFRYQGSQWLTFALVKPLGALQSGCNTFNSRKSQLDHQGYDLQKNRVLGRDEILIFTSQGIQVQILTLQVPHGVLGGWANSWGRVWFLLMVLILIFVPPPGI